MATGSRLIGPLHVSSAAASDSAEKMAIQPFQRTSALSLYFVSMALRVMFTSRLSAPLNAPSSANCRLNVRQPSVCMTKNRLFVLT